jgi:uncharacterized protein
MAQIKQLTRYPIKGFSGENLTEVELEFGGYFPHDREWAIENGASGFDPLKPDYLSKTAFVMLMKQAKLATIKSHLNAKTMTMTLVHGDDNIAAKIDDETGRKNLCAFVKDILGDEVGDLKLLKAPQNFRFMDSRRGFVSIINLETIKALEKEMGKTIDPLRFRGNILIENMPEFFENNLKDYRIQIGSVILRVLKRIERCAATTVNPHTGARDCFIPAALNRAYGHDECGIYCEVVNGGTLELGMSLRLHAPPQMDMGFA